MIYANTNLVQDVFGDWVEPQVAAPPPCRTIPITPEIRARDEAERAAREAKAPDWKIKAELSLQNLQVVRRPLRTARIEPRPRIVLAAPKPKPVREPRPPKVRPQCACGQPMNWGAAPGTKCWTCARQKDARLCAECKGKLHANTQGDICAKCRRPTLTKLPEAIPLDRFCPCGNRLSPRNDGQLCAACNGKAKSKAERMARRVKCDTATCTRMLRWPRRSGICGHCAYNVENRAATVARYREKRTREAGTKCVDCGVPIQWTTKTMRCIKHAAMFRSSRVILRAETKDEHALNVRWSALSLQAKIAALAERSA